MPHAIRITVGKHVFEGELNDSQTAGRIAAALPIEAVAARWGDEIYFEIPVTAAKGEAMRAEMKVGELAFWPPGNAFCIFWGPTPASTADEPRAASPVVPVGKLRGDWTALARSRDGERILIEPAA